MADDRLRTAGAGPGGAPGWPRRGAGAPLVLGHRGGTGPWRENTLDAFEGARRAGADGVELDVRLTADGVPVVNHDAVVEGAGRVSALAAADLPPWVPTLARALDACTGWGLNVEIKNSPGEPGFDERQQVARVVAQMVSRDSKRPGASPLVVSSFWPATLAAVRDAAPDVALGLLTHPALDVVDGLRSAVDLSCVAVHLHHSQARRDVVDRVHELDMTVVAWTVNGEADVAATLHAGVDALITDEVAPTIALVKSVIEGDAGRRGGHA